MFERGVVNKVTYSDSWIDECGLGHACGRGRALARRRAGVGGLGERKRELGVGPYRDAERARDQSPSRPHKHRDFTLT